MNQYSAVRSPILAPFSLSYCRSRQAGLHSQAFSLHRCMAGRSDSNISPADSRIIISYRWFAAMLRKLPMAQKSVVRILAGFALKLAVNCSVPLEMRRAASRASPVDQFHIIWVGLNQDDAPSEFECDLACRSAARERVFCGAGGYVASDTADLEMWVFFPFQRHITKPGQSDSRNAISPASSRQGFRCLGPLISQRASACAFISRSTSA